jgi:hypothetical protein
MNLIDAIIREIFERDPDDWKKPSTVCINIDDLRLILESCIDPEAARATADSRDAIIEECAALWEPDGAAMSIAGRSIATAIRALKSGQGESS